MFDNPISFVKLIGAFTVGAYLIYRFQLFTLIKSTFFNRGKNKLGDDIASKVEHYLSIHDSVLIDENETSSEPIFAEPPRFHILKAIKNDDLITLYFVNQGGDIFNIEVQSSDIPIITIEPAEKILNKESGDLKFYIDDNVNDKISFELIYFDKLKNKATKKYLFSIEDGRLEEIII
ncbi:Acetate kinase [hydrothermal vent metagenome]|uniref:Acetate kinase n=1 Tax=hydrothermal vent metagenome TaxID=652676 RepID=A0A3B1CCL1_9ZZZZ